ncbi:hypothetical protein [Tenacibaculum piscium]|uniref:hypothetical protein n=1 Tax=Tenacibaculum piscium TaxID=1458515 RepID=UPI001F2D7411|nr:hypothetical protein [Tenacibaculum piscium]
MKRHKKCKHCNEFFEARRSNHVYCNASCKTKASYKRNEYKYISGHYQKKKVEQKGLSLPTNTIEPIKVLDNNNISINKSSVTNAVIGSATADAVTYAAKKIFAPNSLYATKGDIMNLNKEINELKRMIIRVTR